MGLFDFLKGPQEIELSLEKLKPWIDQRTKQKDEKSHKKLKIIFERIKKEIQQARDNLENLKTTKLINPKINKRTLQIMEGNRSSYIQKTNHFLDNIILPREISLQDSSNFVLQYEQAIASYSESSARAFYLLKEFMANEVSKIAANIRNIDAFVKEI